MGFACCLGTVWLLVKYSFLFAWLPWFIYTRVYLFYVGKWHYQGQKKMTLLEDCWPILYNFPAVVRGEQINKDTGDIAPPLMPVLTANHGDYVSNAVMWISPEPMVLLCDPKNLEALYTTHNKSFDKHELVKLLTMELTGRSILFAESNPEWRARRKALAPAFYKGKLVKMIEIAKSCVRKTLKHLEGLGEFGVKTKIDLIGEMSSMNIRILLECALGIDITEDMLPYWENGKLVQKDVPYVLRTCF